MVRYELPGFQVAPSLATALKTVSQATMWNSRVLILLMLPELGTRTSRSTSGAVDGTVTLWQSQQVPVYLCATSLTSPTGRIWPSSLSFIFRQAILGCLVQCSSSSQVLREQQTIHGRTTHSFTHQLPTVVSTSAADSIVLGRQQARSIQATSGSQSQFLSQSSHTMLMVKQVRFLSLSQRTLQHSLSGLGMVAWLV